MTDSDKLQDIYDAAADAWPGGVPFIAVPEDWSVIVEGRPILFQGQFTLDAGQQVLPKRDGHAELCTIRGSVAGSQVVVNFDSSKAGQSSNWLTMQRKKECPVQCLGYIENVELGGSVIISPITMGYACRLPWTWGYE